MKLKPSADYLYDPFIRKKNINTDGMRCKPLRTALISSFDCITIRVFELAIESIQNLSQCIFNDRPRTGMCVSCKREGLEENEAARQSMRLQIRKVCRSELLFITAYYFLLVEEELKALRLVGLSRIYENS